MAFRGPEPIRSGDAEWWARLVGALRVHPHKHYANYPLQKDRGFARGALVYVSSNCHRQVGNCSPCGVRATVSTVSSLPSSLKLTVCMIEVVAVRCSTSNRAPSKKLCLDIQPIVRGKHVSNV